MIDAVVLCSCHGDGTPDKWPHIMDPNAYVSLRSVYYGASPLAVRGPKRDRYLVDVRRQIAGELRGAPWRLSYPAIGQALGGRDHSTIMHLLKKRIDG